LHGVDVKPVARHRGGLPVFVEHGAEALSIAFRLRHDPRAVTFGLFAQTGSGTLRARNHVAGIGLAFILEPVAIGAGLDGIVECGDHLVGYPDVLHVDIDHLDAGLQTVELRLHRFHQIDRQHIALFCADTQPSELQALRGVALQWMRRLTQARPHLGGAVWRGTATRRSAIHLDLYCDDPKGTEIELINAGVDYDVGSIERPGAEPVNVLTVGTRSASLSELVSVHLILRDHDDLRGALKPDAQGRSWRGDLAALERLMQADAP
jgi:hypothetical protein